MHPANEKWSCMTSSLIGRAHTQNNPSPWHPFHALHCMSSSISYARQCAQALLPPNISQQSSRETRASLSKYTTRAARKVQRWITKRQWSWNLKELRIHDHCDYLDKKKVMILVLTWVCGPAFVQVMACHLFGAKPLPEPMLVYCQLDS